MSRVKEQESMGVEGDLGRHFISFHFTNAWATYTWPKSFSSQSLSMENLQELLMGAGRLTWEMSPS